MPDPSPAPIDVLFIGGGIAGLWAWRHALLRGYNAALVSTTPLGAGQTIASQGIIHGGIKYALGGEATRASRAIAAMPDLWHASLRGRPAPGHPTLAGAAYLSHQQHLWTTTGLLSRIAGFAASKTLRTGVRRHDAADRPELFRAAPAGVSVYSVEEPVLDVASVVRALADGTGGCSPTPIAAVRALEPSADACAVGLTLCDGASVDLVARRVVLCAGAGTEALLRLAGAEGSPHMQRRPLHMVLLRAPRGTLPTLFGHCLGPSMLPRLTISSASDAEHSFWYLGGRLAEDGVSRTRADQIAAARAEVGACLPWLSLPAAAQWATLRIDRAEGLSPGGTRPDEPVVAVAGPPSVIAAWPTKLAFAPLAAERIAALLGPAVTTPVPEALRAGAACPVAAPPWLDEATEWTS